MLSDTYNFTGIQFLVGITLVFCLLIVVLISFISATLFFLNRREKNYYNWKEISDDIITMAMFFEPDDYDLLNKPVVDVPVKIQKLLANKYFRTIFTNQLLTAKENMLGSSGENLIKLYLQLKLDKYALKLVKSKSWYKKAKGIKELGLMEQSVHKSIVEPFLNHERRLIRIEAQTTMLKFNGFFGLRFLDDATYPISEWHQLKLLEDLAQLPPDDFTGIEKWLNSNNDSVVMFALKLVKNYHLFNYHPLLINLLEHKSDEVRKQAIISLKEIPEETTAQKLIEAYSRETNLNKLEILAALKEVAMDTEIPFFLECLNDTDIDIKFFAATTLSNIKPNGLAQLLNHPLSGTEPLSKIIKHINCTSK